MIEVW